MTEKAEEEWIMTEKAAYLPHDGTAYPHGDFASFTCPTCVKRCIDAGQRDVGRPYIVEHAEEWAQVDGVK